MYNFNLKKYKFGEKNGWICKISDEDFDLIKNAELPVLVDFEATWCGPCKMIEPILEEVAEEEQNSILILKVNIDDCPNSATICDQICSYIDPLTKVKVIPKLEHWANMHCWISFLQRRNNFHNLIENYSIP